MISIKLTYVTVNDQTKARAFYTEVLGFTLKQDLPMGASRWLTVTPQDGGVELLLGANDHPASKVYQEALYADGIPALNLASDDVRAEVERMKAHGVVFKVEPGEAGTNVIAIFDDTCGNLVQLYQA